MDTTISKYHEAAIRRALELGGGGALVSVGNGIDQKRIADSLPEFHHVTVADILAGTAFLPDDACALVVTGYDPKKYTATSHKRDSPEQIIQNWVADNVLSQRGHNPDFQVLVISSGLPKAQVFENQHNRWSRWWPGIDEETGQVFAIDARGELHRAWIEMVEPDSANRQYIWKTAEV